MILGVPSVLAQTQNQQPAGSDEKLADDSAGNESPDEQRKADPIKERRAKFSDAMDEFEKDIADRERQSKYGHPEVEKSALELEERYRRNSDLIHRPSLRTEGDSKQRNTFLGEQRHLEMKLWTLQRIGAELMQDQSKSTQQMIKKMNDLRRDYGTGVNDPALLRRFHALTLRVSELSRARFQRQTNRHFFFARPDGMPAQDPEPQRQDGFTNGPIQGFRLPIGRLIRVSWENGDLTWDQDHWNTPFAGHTLESVDQEVRDELRRNNVQLVEEGKNRVLDFQKKRLFETPPALLLFQDFHHILAQGSNLSNSYSSSGPKYEGRVRAPDIEIAISISPERNEFSIREKTEPRRTLTIEQSNDNRLRLTLIGEKISIVDHGNDGTVRWVSIGEDVKAMRAESFAQLYAMHPEAVEREFFDRLRHFGIHPPMTRFDPLVIERTLERIDSMSNETKNEFRQLLVKMDSDSFSDRQQAYRELTDRFPKYSPLLDQRDQWGELSPEADSRLSKLHEQYRQDFGDVDSLVTKAAWTDDASYLVELISKVPANRVATITGQLNSITGQDFGNDPTRWRDWIATQNRSTE